LSESELSGDDHAAPSYEDSVGFNHCLGLNICTVLQPQPGSSKSCMPSPAVASHACARQTLADDCRYTVHVVAAASPLVGGLRALRTRVPVPQRPIRQRRVLKEYESAGESPDLRPVFPNTTAIVADTPKRETRLCTWESSFLNVDAMFVQHSRRWRIVRRRSHR
jgi:hypothetical protein